MAGPIAAATWILLGLDKLSSIYVGLAISLIVLLMVNKINKSNILDPITSNRK